VRIIHKKPMLDIVRTAIRETREDHPPVDHIELNVGEYTNLCRDMREINLMSEPQASSSHVIVDGVTIRRMGQL
jgi:hypothetical protein